MAQKDTIFNNFIAHTLVIQKSEMESLPLTLAEGLKSKDHHIFIIALIVDKLESFNVPTDNALRILINQSLNDRQL